MHRRPSRAYAARPRRAQAIRPAHDASGREFFSWGSALYVTTQDRRCQRVGPLNSPNRLLFTARRRPWEA